MWKKILAIVVFSLLCCSIFAARNVGDFDLSEVTDTFAKSFITYMKDGDYLDNYYMYGIYQSEDGTWTLSLSRFEDFPDIILFFYTDVVEIVTCGGLSLKDKPLVDILNVVNQKNLEFKNYGTFSYYEDDVWYTNCISNRSLSNITLRTQLEMFEVVSAFGVKEIIESLGL